MADKAGFVAAQTKLVTCPTLNASSGVWSSVRPSAEACARPRMPLKKDTKTPVCVAPVTVPWVRVPGMASCRELCAFSLNVNQ